MSVCNFFGCNEDIFVNILHICQYYNYVELIYTYHTTTYLYLPCTLHACNMHVRFL